MLIAPMVKYGIAHLCNASAQAVHTGMVIHASAVLKVKPMEVVVAIASQAIS
jgi:hypothetical protein